MSQRAAQSGDTDVNLFEFLLARTGAVNVKPKTAVTIANVTLNLINESLLTNLNLVPAKLAAGIKQSTRHQAAIMSASQTHGNRDPSS